MSKLSAQLVALLPGGARGEAFEITGPLMIGRDKTCNIRIMEPSVSRKHAELTLDENGILTLRNLSSTNPTVLNDEVVESSKNLRHGDTLLLGGLSFEVLLPDQKKMVKRLETVDEGNTNTVQEPLKDLSNSPHPPSKKSLPTPLKRAIAARSVADNEAASHASAPSAAAVAIYTPKKTPLKKKGGLPTPLRAAIQSRAQELEGANKVPNTHIHFSPPEANLAPLPVVHIQKPKSFFQELTEALARRKKTEKSLTPRKPAASVAPLRSGGFIPTPLKRAIEARFRSSFGGDERLQQPEQAPRVEKEERAVRLGKYPPTPLREAIRQRRKSFGADKEAADIKKRALATPLRKAIQAKAVDGKGEKKAKGLPTPLRRAIENMRDKKTADKQNISVDDSLSLSMSMSMSATPVVADKRRSSKLTPQSTHIRFDDESSREELAVDTLFAMSLQISKEVMQGELQEEETGVLGDFASTLLLLSPVQNAVNTPVSSPRRNRDSLLSSLGKRAESREAGREEGKDLVAALSDEDMQVIEEYAERLQGVGGDEAFAMALDAYLLGMQQAKVVQQMVSDSMEEKQEGVEVEEAAVIEGEIQGIVEEDKDAVEGYKAPPPTPAVRQSFSSRAPRNPRLSLSDLLADLPLARLFAQTASASSQSDRELVEWYAKELESSGAGGVDAGVAFGVSLDTYLADKQGFRERVGRMMRGESTLAVPSERERINASSDVEGEIVVSDEVAVEVAVASEEVLAVEELNAAEDAQAALLSPTPAPVMRSKRRHSAGSSPAPCSLLSPSANPRKRTRKSMGLGNAAPSSVETPVPIQDEAEQQPVEMAVAVVVPANSTPQPSVPAPSADVPVEETSEVKTKTPFKGGRTPKKAATPSPTVSSPAPASAPTPQCSNPAPSVVVVVVVEETREDPIADKTPLKRGRTPKKVATPAPAVSSPVAPATIPATTPMPDAACPVVSAATPKLAMSSPSPAAADTAVTAPSEVVEEGMNPSPVKKTPRKRGRTPKKAVTPAAAAAATPQPAVSSPVAADPAPTPKAVMASPAAPAVETAIEVAQEVVIASPVKAAAPAAVPAVDAAVEVAIEVAEESANPSPVKKGRGGRKIAAKRVEAEVKVEVEAPVVPVPAPAKRGGRGAKKTEAPEPFASVEVQLPATEIKEEIKGEIKVEVAVKKGGRGKKVEATAPSASLPEAVPAPVEDEVKVEVVGAKRGRGKKMEVEEVVFTESAPVEPPAKRGRGKAAPVPAQTEKVVDKKSVRGRGKKDVEEQEEMEEALAILCDGCDGEFFVDEVGLTCVPKGDWFCAKCTQKKVAKKTAPAAASRSTRTRK